MGLPIMQNIKSSIANDVVKKRILAIAKKDNLPAEKVYAVIDVYDKYGSFRILLYNKDNLTAPIREISLGELL